MQELIEVSVDQLLVDPAYQPSVSQARVKTIVRNYNPDLMLPIHVSRRANGDCYIIDGQHRVLAALTLGIKKLWAFVFSNLTKAQESTKWIELNTLRRQNISSVARFNAELAAEVYETVQIQRVLTDYGLRVSKNGVSSPAALRVIWHCFGEKYLRQAIEVLAAAYPDNHHRWVVPIMESVAAFFYSYPGAKSKRLVGLLQDTNPRSINADIKDHHRLFGASQRAANRWGHDTSRLYESQYLVSGSEVLKTLYNKKLRANKL
jgi:hypothetical protein